MKIINPSDPGSLYLALNEQLTKAPDERIVLQLGEGDLHPYQALAIHDILDGFTAHLDIHVEMLFDSCAFTWCAISTVPVEKRTCLPNTTLSFSSLGGWHMGDATNMLISGKHLANIEDRLVAIIVNETQMDQATLRLMMQERRHLHANELIENGFFGGAVHV